MWRRPAQLQDQHGGPGGVLPPRLPGVLLNSPGSLSLSVSFRDKEITTEPTPFGRFNWHGKGLLYYRPPRRLEEACEFFITPGVLF
jgi:hypothetical protein